MHERTSMVDVARPQSEIGKTETGPVPGAMFACMKARFARLRRLDAERGATMLEYALVATFIAVVVATAARALGPAVASLFDSATAGF